MSFLKNRHILRSGSSTDHDTSMRPPTVSEVSDSHEDDSYVVQQRSDSKQSALSGLRGARGEPGMRKSLRSSCSSIEGRESPAISSTALPGKQDGGFKVKARKVSRSVKTKLKSFFTLSKSEDVPSSIPCQHVEAKKSHVSEGFGTFRSFESQVDDACGPIHNVQTKVPSLQIVPSDLIRSNKGSVESLRSERDRDRERERKVSDDKTSFTSWTNSGPSTLTSQQQQQWSEWEAQRLSTIKENGPHAPSSSLRRMPLQTNLFEPPDDEDQNTPPAMSNVKIDSQRVYSALMKRMKVLNAQVAQTMEQPQITVETTEVVERMVTAKSEDMTPGTARRPGAGQQRFALSDTADTPTRPSKGPRAADEQSSEIKVVGNTGHGYMARAKREAKDICAAFKIGGSRAGSMGTANPIHAMPEPSGKDGLPLFAPSTEPAHVAAEKTAQDSKSPLFGSSGSHTFRTESPYRRALRRSMEEEQKVWSQQHLASQLQALKDDADAHDDTGESGSDSGKDLDYSESVYSTDEIEAAGRGTDVARGQGSRGWKAANRQSTETPATYQPKGYHRETSSASSVDWKTWLSANIAKLDSSPPLPKPPSEVEYALPTMPNNFSGGHVREAAQIYGDEDDYLELPTRKPTLPTTPLTPVEPNVVKIQPAQRSVKRNSPPSGGRTLPENDIPGGPPPIPIKSALRPSPLKISRPNTGRSITTPSITSSPGLTAAVQRQFGPVSRQVDGDYKNCGVQLRQRPSGRLRTVESVDGGFGGFGSDSDTGAFI
ncbi:hypothetical protein QBC35DRAFT_499168 [Podospora australis]|uniref:Uncharacterized protein n=1 Tax=Podospora australis TaxID=1536484 RepID=A0AAN6WS08_9PEZI|nr:hypothetical protein QBC35DRAFT_499168 [Podospora australis]